MKGRPRKPSHLKLIAGTYRPDRAPKHEAMPVVGIGEPPDYLNAEQVAAWRMFAAASPPGLLTVADRGCFESYVVLFVARRIALESFNEGGMKILVRDKSRSRNARNPYLRELEKLTALLSRLEQSLGYSPASRSRVELSSTDGKPNRLTKYLGDD